MSAVTEYLFRLAAVALVVVAIVALGLLGVNVEWLYRAAVLCLLALIFMEARR